MKGEDGKLAVEFCVGPSCSKRLHLYHEIHHYKVQLYQSISEEYNGMMDRPKWSKKLDKVDRCPKGRVIGEDLESLASEIFAFLRNGKSLIFELSNSNLKELYFSGTIRVSFAHYERLLANASEIDMLLSYGHEEE